jgi:hypothetical protein
MDCRSKIELEVDAIRLAIYEETKGMTTRQRLEYKRDELDAAAKKYGYKVVPSLSRTAPKASGVTV